MELGLTLLIVVLLFGANRIPALMEGIGKGIRGLKRGLNEDENISVNSGERIASGGGDAIEDANVVEDETKTH